MKTGELLVELGTEEIPAGMLARAAHEFADLLQQRLKEERLEADGRTVYYTPRRLVVALSGIPEKQEDLVEQVTGPPKKVAFDASGAPTRAAVAFAEKNSVALDRLQLIQTPKGEYLSVQRRVKGEATRRLLERILPECVARVTFPKTMHWTSDGFRFARPLRWIVALFAGRVIRFQVADVESSRRTSGHRQLGKARIPVSSPEELKSALMANGVVLDPAERRDRIEKGLAAQAATCEGFAAKDEDLLETVINLHEWPTVIHGTFDPLFLELPQEILITVMREHQKYFSVVDSEGRLLPFFLAVINSDGDREGEIRAGHERVLRARLADARFFWDTDRKKPLEARLESLRQVLFQEKLGSYHDKTTRILSVLARLAEAADMQASVEALLAAGRLSKCDLITEMVKEFPDLQGVVGGLYAKEDGLDEAVWRAVYEHYQPKSAGAPSPATATGALLALADRLDTICGCFGVGLIPTGSRDPFALRRQGNGVLKIILDRKLGLSLTHMIGWSLESHDNESPQVRSELSSFFEGRLRFILEEMAFSYDGINAGLAVGFDNPLEALERVAALEEVRREPDFLALASNFKRVKNILAQAGKNETEPDLSLITDPAESALWKAYLEVRPAIEDARKRGAYAEALRAMASLRPTVDRFFDEVLVMAEDPDLRKNRLALLGQLDKLFLTVADISHMVVEKSGSQGTS